MKINEIIRYKKLSNDEKVTMHKVNGITTNSQNANVKNTVKNETVKNIVNTVVNKTNTTNTAKTNIIGTTSFDYDNIIDITSEFTSGQDWTSQYDGLVKFSINNTSGGIDIKKNSSSSNYLVHIYSSSSNSSASDCLKVSNGDKFYCIAKSGDACALLIPYKN